MCGLVGMMGAALDQDRKGLRNLLRLDTFRGEDSTGLAVIHKDQKIEVLKKVGVPEYLFSSFDEFDGRGVYKKSTGKMFIGHNRAATRGKVTDENAHPFHHNTVVGAHNGTLKSTYQLEDAHKFDVDSEAIFYNLDKSFDVEKTIGKIHGAYALTWYDSVTDTANFIRNKERPLFWTRRKDREVIFWASQAWMLEYGLGYAGISHEEIHEFATDTLYQFDLSYKDTLELKKIEFTMEEGIKGWTPPPSVPLAGTKNMLGGAGTKGGAGSSHAGPFPKTTVPYWTGSMNSPANSATGKASGSQDRSKEEKKAMKAFQNKEIKFRFDRLLANEMSNTPYLRAYFADPTIDFEVRVFGASHTDWAKWQANTHMTTYKGLVKRFVEHHIKGKRQCYLLMDLRTIEPCFPKLETNIKTPKVKVEISPLSNSVYVMPTNMPEKVEDLLADDKKDELILGFQGRYLNGEEWDKATGSGCSGCMKGADKNDEGIVFIDHDAFLCGGCAASAAYSSVVSNFKQ